MTHETNFVEGPVGPIEVLIDRPAGPARGIALVAHPQPLLGGSAGHKIPQLLARAVSEAGWWAARPNFRGVGKSAGTHDNGVGETDDLLAVAAALQAQHAGVPLALIGFSFGAFVQSRVARALVDRGQPARRVVLAGLPAGEVAGGRHYAPERRLPELLIIHGERDERIALQAVLDWARPDSQPVLVVPNADHFFTGKLPILRSLILNHLAVVRGASS